MWSDIYGPFWKHITIQLTDLIAPFHRFFNLLEEYWQDEFFCLEDHFFLCRGTTCASFSLFGNWLCFIVLFKSVVICLLSTGAPALRSLHDIWSTPVAFLILILLTSFVIVSVFVNLKSKLKLLVDRFFWYGLC